MESATNWKPNPKPKIAQTEKEKCQSKKETSCNVRKFNVKTSRRVRDTRNTLSPTEETSAAGVQPTGLHHRHLYHFLFHSQNGG